MPKITFIHPDDRRTTVEIASGLSLMQGATRHGIVEIVGECGGCAMCATCHVQIVGGPASTLPPMSEDEDALLDGTAAPRQANSRLSCQIEVTPSLEGLEVRLPDRQI